MSDGGTTSRRHGRDQEQDQRQVSAPPRQAVLKPERRLSFVWLVPIAALLLGAWLGFSAWRQRGFTITVHFPEGYGLKVGAEVRYRGTTVGEVRDIEMTDDLGGVVVTVGLRVKADRLARAGTRFWVVRPRLRLTEVEGLETLLGPRYVAVVPGGAGPDGARASRQREFVGLADAPVVESIDPGDLEIVLESPRRGSVRGGAAVTYRQVRVGTVLSVGLASDASTVEARVHIRKAYRAIVRERTKFWDSGGIKTDLRLSGLTVEVDSLEEAITGGVALATPPTDQAGDEVRTGHRFVLHEQSEKEWLAWRTSVAVGSSLLPPGSSLPQPLRAVIGWEQGFILKGTRSRQGWVLQMTDGLLGPADLLEAPPGKNETDDAVRLEVGGQAVPLADSADARGLLSRLAIRVSEVVWPDRRVRRPDAPEDCIAVGDPTAPPFPLGAARLTPDGPSWLVDPAVSLDDTWHGASVLARSDGRLVGLLLVGEDAVRVGLVGDAR